MRAKNLLRDIPAVILAAGEGSRLRNSEGEVPKPLVRIYGLSLLERSLLTFKTAGVRKFYVVVGFQKDRVIEHARELAEKHDIFIEIISSDCWQLGNGASASAPAGRIDKPFFLAMCDHLFDPEIPVRLFEAECENNSAVCRLAVDRNFRGINDVGEATLVSILGDTVVDIGKGIPNADAMDTGIFLCKPELFDVLKKAISQGKGNLSDALRLLIPEKKFKVVDVTGLFWFDIDTPGDLKKAEDSLLALLKRSKNIDGPVSKYINRHFSIEITRRIARKSITPNQVSVVGAVVGILGAMWFFISGMLADSAPLSSLACIIAGLLVQVSSIIDGVDGEIARLKFQHSPYGAYVDHMLDRYVDGLVVCGIVFALFKTSGSLSAFLWGGLALIGLPLSSIHRAKFRAETGRNYLPEEDGFLRVLPYSRDVRLFVVFLGAVFGRIDFVLYYLSIVPNVVSIIRFRRVKKAMEDERVRAVDEAKRFVITRADQIV